MLSDSFSLIYYLCLCIPSYVPWFPQSGWENDVVFFYFWSVWITWGTLQVGLWRYSPASGTLTEALRGPSVVPSFHREVLTRIWFQAGKLRQSSFTSDQFELLEGRFKWAYGGIHPQVVPSQRHWEAFQWFRHFTERCWLEVRSLIPRFQVCVCV